MRFILDVALGRFKNKNIGIVLDWSFHHNKKWVSALTPYLVDSLIRETSPIIISSQFEYNLIKDQLDVVICFEPGWCAPFIEISGKHKLKMIFLSDPHSKTSWFERYFSDNKFDFVLSYYKSPFFYHFPNFPPSKFIYFPWALPDSIYSERLIPKADNADVVIFGGGDSEAYDVRNDCRNHPDILNYYNSGVENKVLSDSEYFGWLSTFNAIIAAGSSHPKYDLVTPKYFEICFSGSLLIGQYCKDLDELGFSEDNSIIFSPQNFSEKIKRYKENPNIYYERRILGQKLILRRHLISHRVKLIVDLIEKHLGGECLK